MQNITDGIGRDPIVGDGDVVGEDQQGNGKRVLIEKETDGIFQVFVQGDPCPAAAPTADADAVAGAGAGGNGGKLKSRHATATFLCNDKLLKSQHSFWIREPQLCAYAFTIYTPLVCGLY